MDNKFDSLFGINAYVWTSDLALSLTLSLLFSYFNNSVYFLNCSWINYGFLLTLSSFSNVNNDGNFVVILDYYYYKINKLLVS